MGFWWRGVSARLRLLGFGGGYVSARLKVLWSRGSGGSSVITAAQQGAAPDRTQRAQFPGDYYFPVRCVRRVSLVVVWLRAALLSFRVNQLGEQNVYIRFAAFAPNANKLN